MASCHVVAQPVASRQHKHTYFTLKYFEIKGTVFTVTAPFIWSRSMCSPRVSASMPKKLQILQEQFRVFKELLGHRIMLTSPSSHSREKDLSWKDPHTLLWVVCDPSGSPGSCSASSSFSATSTSPNEDSSCSEESKFLAPAPYASP